jgi:hypothetical protein
LPPCMRTRRVVSRLVPVTFSTRLLPNLPSGSRVRTVSDSLSTLSTVPTAMSSGSLAASPHAANNTNFPGAVMCRAAAPWKPISLAAVLIAADRCGEDVKGTI